MNKIAFVTAICMVLAWGVPSWGMEDKQLPFRTVAVGHIDTLQFGKNSSSRLMWFNGQEKEITRYGIISRKFITNSIRSHITALADDGKDMFIANCQGQVTKVWLENKEAKMKSILAIGGLIQGCLYGSTQAVHQIIVDKNWLVLAQGNFIIVKNGGNLAEFEFEQKPWGLHLIDYTLFFINKSDFCSKNLLVDKDPCTIIHRFKKHDLDQKVDSVVVNTRGDRAVATVGDTVTVLDMSTDKVIPLSFSTQTPQEKHNPQFIGNTCLALLSEKDPYIKCYDVSTKEKIQLLAKIKINNPCVFKAFCCK